MRAVLVGMAACSHVAPAPVGHTAVTTTTLEAQLIAEVGAGQPVAILGGASVRAVSADGARSRVLANVAAPWVLVDHRAQVIWFGTDHKHAIAAIDLEADTAKLVTVATGIGRVVAGEPIDQPLGDTPFDFAIVHGDEREPLHVASLSAPHAALHVTAEPALDLIREGNVDPGDRKLFLGNARIVAREFVVAVAARHPGRAPFVRGDDEVPRTRLRIVTTMHSCSFDIGHGCPSGTTLYNPETREFHTGAWSKVLDDAWLAPDGSTFAVGDQLVRTSRAALGDDWTVNAAGGGWLGDGSYYYGH